MNPLTDSGLPVTAALALLYAVLAIPAVARRPSRRPPVPQRVGAVCAERRDDALTWGPAGSTFPGAGRAPQ